MKVLAFDTATDDTVVAAAVRDELVFERALPPGDRPVHSQALLELGESAAEALGGWGAVDRIAVGVGPGTFTGIRIGVATAAGLAASTGTDVTGVSTLAALARSIGRGKSETLVVPLIDARRGEVFGMFARGDGQPLGDPFVCGPQELVRRLREAPESGPAARVGGPGAVRFRNELLRAGFHAEPAGSPVHRLDGRALCDLGARAARTGPETLEPLYLRTPDAQLWLQRDGKPDQRDPEPR